MNDEKRLGKSSSDPYGHGIDSSIHSTIGRHFDRSCSNGEELKLSLTPQKIFGQQVQLVVDELATVLVSKQNDYGPLNISNAPGGPLNGLQVRIYDKVSRINNLIATGATPENESLRDSFLDLANYGLIALMVLDGTWPELPKENK